MREYLIALLLHILRVASQEWQGGSLLPCLKNGEVSFDKVCTNQTIYESTNHFHMNTFVGLRICMDISVKFTC